METIARSQRLGIIGSAVGGACGLVWIIPGVHKAHWPAEAAWFAYGVTGLALAVMAAAVVLWRRIPLWLMMPILAGAAFSALWAVLLFSHFRHLPLHDPRGPVEAAALMKSMWMPSLLVLGFSGMWACYMKKRRDDGLTPAAARPR